MIRPPLLGWALVTAGVLAGVAINSVSTFVALRVGESGARKLLAACTNTAEKGLIVRDSDGTALWIASPRDTVRRRYAPKP